MQKLANILLMHDEHKSTIQLKHVTPAELLILVTDFHINVKGDPCPTSTHIREIPADHEQKLIAPLEKQVEELQEQLDDLDNPPIPETGSTVVVISEEIREKRKHSLTSRIERLEDQISDLQRIIALRNLTPENEKKRLMGKYGKIKVSKFFSDAIPRLPETFEQAKAIGLSESFDVGFLEQSLSVTEIKASAA
jgi:polyhydroxyalkanoate synthesis regulator phasin